MSADSNPNLSKDFAEAFYSEFREFFGDETDCGYEIYFLNGDDSGPKGRWATFTVRNPLASRSLVFRYDPSTGSFYAMLKIQVIPGEEDWDLDALFRRKGFSAPELGDSLAAAGEWLFHSIARHYFGAIFRFCPRILEPDFFPGD
ncbi:hypothetical protein EHQ12_01745 [Leptospira gomenensis]|uniref:Uncharacterized protein n=1 Tax=Leptospira gomenensis TaxID=2484974 RepID=A0A5F1YE22_9LEPT|nr:hypothetical protein [Leptospira gomenensis]TGK36385.1 hypothetical protein EHQ17_04360 [Leptospira gomenensis]TGK43409.1 hypothetical protein EHQ07_12645 [Leptospira gomenensis]TGK44412.1 hypothetical protein EHQ12_01745 [Leptospira gomenensis]TGK67536.1 hypothetical protein EHQ13_01935 [Leptospira gomenensis]